MVCKGFNKAHPTYFESYAHLNDELEQVYRWVYPQPKDSCRCGMPTTFISYEEGYTACCSPKCAASDPVRNAKIQQTILARYNGKHYMCESYYSGKNPVSL